jgi:hypothetical protein
MYGLHWVFGSNAELTRAGAGVARPQQVKGATVPRPVTLTTTAPAAGANCVAQGDGDTILCGVTVNGEVKVKKTSDGVNAQTFCLVKSA